MKIDIEKTFAWTLYAFLVIVIAGLVIALFMDILTSTAHGAEAGIQYPDPVYWEDVAGMPDKWEHYVTNQAGSYLVKNEIGKPATVAICTFVNVMKEFDDGRREGISIGDLIADNLGLISGLYGIPLICGYGDKTIYIQYYFR